MLPASEFVLFLLHEIFPRRIRLYFVRAGCHRYFRAAAAYNTVPAACGSPLGTLLAPPLRLAARASLFRRIRSQLPRKPGHTAPCENHFAVAHVGHDALLHILAAYRMVVGAGAAAGRRHRGDVAYPFVRYAEEKRVRRPGSAGMKAGELFIELPCIRT